MAKASLNLKKLLVLAFPTLGLLISPNSAWAGANIYALYSTCTSLDCGGLTLNGTMGADADGPDPVVMQLWSAGNECLRVTVSTQGGDMEGVLVAPNGTAWRDDDGNGSLRPRLAVVTPVAGWYTLQMSRYDGTATPTDFTFKYGRYASSNVNCSSPTATLGPASGPALAKPAASFNQPRKN